MNVSTLSEAELLGLMSAQARASEQARGAWGELYARHRRYVYLVVSRAYGTFLGEDGTVDLVCETFRRAYEWAGRQKDPEQVRAQFSAETPDATRRRVLAWLGAIANRLFKDRYREAAVSAEEFQAYLDDWKASKDRSGELNHSPALDHLDAALALLTPGEAEALRVSLPWYDVDARSFAFPRGEAARVARLLGISTDSLRQRRHRAIERIQEHFEQAGFGTLTQKETA